MLKSLKLNGVGPVQGLEASFGERLNLITGDNGLGKSFLLDTVFWALTGTWPGGRIALPDSNGKKEKPFIAYHLAGKKGPTKDPKKAEFDYHAQTWKRKAGRPVMPGLVIYAAIDGSFAVWDPARNYWRDLATGEKEITDQPRAYQFTPESLAEGLVEGNRTLCNGLIQDWVNWYYQQTTESTNNPFQYLKTVVKSLSHPQEPMDCGEPKRVYVDDARTFPTLKMPYGIVPFPHWSAGVRRVISFAYLLVWSWYEHQQAAQLRNETPTDQLILIIDEIEAHLHPKWQRTILPALLQVAAQLQSQIQIQIFTATHSPLILASTEPYFDNQKDKLFWFDLREKTVHFQEYPWAIHGDMVGWLTSEIFGLKQARSRESEQAITAAEAFMRGDFKQLPKDLQTKDEIHAALVRYLPGLDPFWPRWIVEVNP